MKKRKGSMALCLLILFSMLLTLFTGLLFFLSHTAAEVYLYREGLRSVYGAESGANWAIGYLKEGNIDSASASFTENGRSVTVMVQKDSKTGSGTITSTAIDDAGGNKRILQLTYTQTMCEDGESVVTVTDVRTGL